MLDLATIQSDLKSFKHGELLECMEGTGLSHETIRRIRHGDTGVRLDTVQRLSAWLTQRRRQRGRAA